MKEINFSDYTVKEITYEESKHFILDLHYAQRKPNISWIFGLFLKDSLLGVCSYGKSASPYLGKNMFSIDLSSKVYELNRLILLENLPKNTASFFVAKTLKMLKNKNLVIVSFSDLGMNHTGYIYQALNFYFTGTTKKRTDIYNKYGHARHAKKEAVEKYRTIRTPKNRYVYFNCSSKLKKLYKKEFNYEILQYPKAVNKRYILGEKQKIELIDMVTKNKIFI